MTINGVFKLTLRIIILKCRDNHGVSINSSLFEQNSKIWSTVKVAGHLIEQKAQ